MKGEIKMKKILFSIAIVLTVSITANAQSKNDDFFRNDWGDGNRFGETVDFTLVMPSLGLGVNGNSDAPLGSGLLVLTALSAGYAVARKRKR